MSIDNINSGCTTGGLNSKIIIWRIEEFAKVLIHELIHFYKLENTWILDVSTSSNQPVVEKELRTWITYQIFNCDFSDIQVTTGID